MMDMINKCHAWCGHRYMKVVARVFMSALFIIIGGSKLMNFTGTAAFIGSAGLPVPTVLTALAIIFELGGGLMLLFGFKKRLAIAMLVAFTVVSTALFHIKNVTTDQLQTIMFLKNLAIVGGLLSMYRTCGKDDCEGCNGEGGTCTTCQVK